MLKNGASYMNMPKNKNEQLPKKLFVKTNDKIGIIALDWYGDKQCWCVTGYYKSDKNKR